MKEEELERILRECMEAVGVDENVRIRLKKYKTKAASVNMRKKIITLNEDVLDLGEDVIRYLILHELIHLKLKSPYHDKEFKEFLEKNLHGLDVLSVRGKILDKLFKIRDARQGD